MHEYGKDALTEISYLVLLALCQPNHGYEIMRFLDDKTNGRIKPGAGTLYGAINTLEKKGWIRLLVKDNKKNIYIITDNGKIVLKKEILKLKQNYMLGMAILEGGIDYENF